ncbi:MAG: GNAT family N-acetyltransferase, partial [Lachnospiraceae bacterium]|nr:GNAT family N-acetyltransferase [Lachnospiraceae bacterium]
QSSEDMEPEKRKAVHLEPLQAGEVQSWIQMQNETFFFTVNSGTYETGMVKEEQEAGSRFFWICDGETKVGTLILIPKEDSLFIDGIAVSSRYQGRGYGRAALECCGRMAAGLGMGTLSLIVADSNLHAKNLYERTGFVCTGRGPEWFCTESSLMQ